MVEKKNHYQVLQVDPSAEQEIISAAYKKLALKYHPDVNKSPEATQAMQQINAAFQVLSSPAERARYDQELKSQQEAPVSPANPPQARVQTTQEYPYQGYQQKYPFQSSGTKYRGAHNSEWLKREQSRANNERVVQKLKREKASPYAGWGIFAILLIAAAVLLLELGMDAASTAGAVILGIALIAAIQIARKWFG